MYRLPRFVCFALAAALCAAAACPALANDLQVGKPAPPIALQTLDGHRITLAQLRGKTVILTFWATWCAPCQEELPLLSNYADAHRDDGLVVLGISLDTPDTLAQVQRTAKALSFPVGLLGDPHVPGYGRIWRLPVTFVIDRDGRLVHDGWKDKQPEFTRERLDQVVTPLLQAPPPTATPQR
jgi:peroxiredoxin